MIAISFKTQAASARCKASRAKSTYINSTGSKSFARILQEESRSRDLAHENPEGSGSDHASVGAERSSTRSYEPGAFPKDLQVRAARQSVRAKRRVEDNKAATLRKEAIVMDGSCPKDIQERALWEAARAKRRAEYEAVTLRKKVAVMEESQKRLKEDLARMTNAVSAMQKMMSTVGLPNGSMSEPTVPPGFQQIGPGRRMPGVHSGSSIHLLAR